MRKAYFANLFFLIFMFESANCDDVEPYNGVSSALHEHSIKKSEGMGRAQRDMMMALLEIYIYIYQVLSVLQGRGHVE